MALTLHLRRRFNIWQGEPSESSTVQWSVEPTATALLLCDMWDDHWCQSAARRCADMAYRMDPVVASVRAMGMQIIHAPSDCMDFYQGMPQRVRMTSLKKIAPPLEQSLDEPSLPIDDTDGGCDDVPSSAVRKAWTRQHPAIVIADSDVISDSGHEVYSLLQQKSISTLLIMGVHTNMCVVGRSFGIRQMTRWGVNCVLVRDMTDAMYNPARPPYVTHAAGTNLVIEHIERYLCPTIASDDLLPT